MLVWIALNIYGAFRAWDPYPFILLNFVLSTLAAIQAPIILMSQNLEMERDRRILHYDFEVDKLTGEEIADMQKDLDEIKALLMNRKR